MSGFTLTHDLEEVSDAPLQKPGKATSRSSYSYLFPDLAEASDAGCFAGTDEPGTIERLKEFEEACRLGNRPAPTALNFNVPAAYTYFGQFLNHDISAPAGGLLLNMDEVRPLGIVGTVDPEGLGKDWRGDVAAILRHFVNEHPRPMTLGSLYGDGPDSSDDEVRALYTPDGRRFRLASAYRVPDDILGESTKLFYNAIHAEAAPDIPRKGRLPLIADRRNDGNLILSQLHLAFMRFHNKAVSVLEKKGTPGDQVFDKAREEVTRHYHWLILNDFLPALLSKKVLEKPLSEWQPRHPPPSGTVPMEFTTAAFRFGHSMVGRSYDFNVNFGRGGRLLSEATLEDLLAFTSDRQMGDPLGRIPQLPDHWVIDWDRLTRNQPPGAPRGASGQAERIDLDFAPDMLNAAGDARVIEHGSIFFRNLLRGFHRRIPFGQKLADQYNVPRLSRDQIKAAMPQGPSPAGTYPADSAATLGILDETPAWLYFLCEAQALEEGTRVGPTASHIIADTIVSLLRGQSSAVLGKGGAAWHPKQSRLLGPLDKPLVSLRAFLEFAGRRD